MAYVDCTGEEKSLFYCRHEGEKHAGCSRRDTAGVVCKLDKPNVRLVGSPLAHAGVAQIRHYGRWGSFCDWGWGLAQGHVVCRELGYRRALFTTLGEIFEKQTGYLWIEEAQCTGNESSIFHCDLTYIQVIDDIWGCSHDDAGGVICESIEELGLNETASVRLQGGNSTHMGGVEIKQHGFWHAVCSIGWDKHDADVVCRQLGFTQAVLEVGHGQFGSGPGPTWLTSVRCYGNETSLDQCVSAGWELEADCGERLGAGVICKMDNITDDGDVRLRGSNITNEFEGRVEVKLGGIWGTVSESNWDIRDGHVVCRQLGYRRAVRVYSRSRYGDGGMKFWLSDLHCSGNESNLLECPRELNYKLYVWDVQIAGVECTNDTDYRSEVEVRLVGMDRPNVGHVQVKYNGTWGTICERRDLTYQSAEVICRQLGQGPPVKHKFSHKECTATNQGAEAVWLSDLKCQGFEDSIDECPHRGWGRLDPEYCKKCAPEYCSVCLICHPRDANITDIALRLVGSNLPYAGRVEVRYAGVWGLICPRRMNDTVFKVICRQLGFEDVMGDGRLYGRADYPHRRFRLYGEGRGPIWLSKVRCHGNESSLSQCEIESPGVSFWCIHEETLELMCRPKNFTPPYRIRLAGAPVLHAGRVEVFYNGSWGTVCSEVRQWDISTANALVACRQLGFGPAIRSSTSWIDPQYSNCPAREHPTGAIWLSDVQCRGNESSIDQCPHLGWGVKNGHCGGHTADACLVCENPQYRDSEIAVRLSGSEVPYAGRVKVRYQGVWGTLCDYDWKLETAEVLCRQLGYKDVELDLNLFHAHNYYRRMIYKVGPGPVWFNSDGCSGHEKSLSECNLQHETYCSSDEVELICKVDNVSVNEFAVRLRGADGGNHSKEGRVEVFYGGLWGTVSAKKWDLTDALVVCRQLGYTKVEETYNKKPKPERVIWFTDFECQGSETTLGQCKHRILAQVAWENDDFNDVHARCGEDEESKSESTTGPTVTSVNIPRPSPTATLEIPRASSQRGSPTKALAVTLSSTEVPNTRTLPPIQTSSTQGPSPTSAPSTTAPRNECPSARCQNGGSCERLKNSWKCQCLEKFAGEYCEIYVGSNAVSIVLKMTLEQWNPVEFKKTLAEILTSHCRLNPCLDEEKNTKTKSQKKSPSFQRDDIIILQGYPKAWQGMSLLNVRFAVTTPEESGNNVIPHEILSNLMVKVAPEIHRRLGHGVAYIDRVEIHSGQVPSVPPEASGRNSDEPDSVTSHKYALIVLGVLLGVVCLVAIVIIVLYRRKTKRRKTSLREDGLDEKPGENIRLMSL
ncbi:hypothetical protein ACROYT_G041775 [Oculina patagonica]